MMYFTAKTQRTQRMNEDELSNMVIGTAVNVPVLKDEIKRIVLELQGSFASFASLRFNWLFSQYQELMLRNTSV